MPTQPQSIITNGVPPPNPNDVLHYYIKEKVVQATARDKKILQTLISQCISLLFSIFYRFFKIPKVHSLSLQTLSKFVEKYSSKVEQLAPLYGQID
jgi:hypothetical protein